MSIRPGYQPKETGKPRGEPPKGGSSMTPPPAICSTCSCQSTRPGLLTIHDERKWLRSPTPCPECLEEGRMQIQAFGREMGERCSRAWWTPSSSAKWLTPARVAIQHAFVREQFTRWVKDTDVAEQCGLTRKEMIDSVEFTEPTENPEAGRQQSEPFEGRVSGEDLPVTSGLWRCISAVEIKRGVAVFTAPHGLVQKQPAGGMLIMIGLAIEDSVPIPGDPDGRHNVTVLPALDGFGKEDGEMVSGETP